METRIEIRPLQSRKDRKRFATFPWKIYRGEFGTWDAWVPPLLVDEMNQLNAEKHPFYHHSDVEHFLAWKGGSTVGRISAIVDRAFNEHNGSSTGFFGFFESPDDPEIAATLVSTAERWLAERGMTEMIGPVNLSTNHILGALIDDFDNPPVVQMGYNPPYYPRLYEELGLTKYRDLLSYRIDAHTLDLSDKIRRVQEIARKRNRIEMRRVSIKRDWHWVVPAIRDIYNEAWSNNWGFVPWTEEEFEELAKELRMLVDEDLVPLAMIDNEPVGFAIAIPNINIILHKMNGRLLPTGIFRILYGRKRIDQIRVAAMGVRHAHHNKGIDAVLIDEMWKRGRPKGISKADFSWILEENLDLRNLLDAWGTEHYRTHRIYGKELTQQ